MGSKSAKEPLSKPAASPRDSGSKSASNPLSKSKPGKAVAARKEVVPARDGKSSRKAPKRAKVVESSDDDVKIVDSDVEFHALKGRKPSKGTHKDMNGNKRKSSDRRSAEKKARKAPVVVHYAVKVKFMGI